MRRLCYQIGVGLGSVFRYFLTARRCALSRMISVMSWIGRISQGPIVAPGWFDMI